MECLYHKDHGDVPYVVIPIRSRPHSFLIAMFVIRVKRRVPLVEQELLTITWAPIFSFLCNALRSLFFLLSFFFWPLYCLFFWSLYCLFFWPLYCLFFWPLYCLFFWPLHCLFFLPLYCLFFWPLHCLFFWSLYSLFFGLRLLIMHRHTLKQDFF